MIDWSLLILRIGVGCLFIVHGSQEAFGVFGGTGIQGFACYLSGMGFPQSVLLAHVSAYLKITAGVCISVGLFTKRLLFLLLMLIFAAVVKVHIAKGAFILEGDEYKFILYSVLTVLLMLGPGNFSIIKKLKKHLKNEI